MVALPGNLFEAVEELPFLIGMAASPFWLQLPKLPYVKLGIVC